MITRYYQRALSSIVSSRADFFRSFLPLIWVLVGLSTVFFFVSDRGYFHRNTWNLSDHFPWTSSHTLAIAANFSPDHNFLGFVSQSINAEGNIVYSAYNRFTPVGYALIKLITLPFGDDLSNRIYAAQMLMLVFFIGTAVLAYWSLCRLISNRWIASSVILIVFSSTPFLSYNDMILNETGSSLFGLLLTFHGMVIFVQEGRFRQLLIKACLAVLLGWHVMALLFSFVLLSLLRKIVRGHRGETIRRILFSLVVSQYFILGVITLGLGILVLAYNIGNEFYAINIREMRQSGLSDLPSFHSILYRTGLGQGQEFASGKALDFSFLEDQFTKIGLMAVPLLWSGLPYSYSSEVLLMIEIQNFYIGIVVTVICVVGIFFVRYRLLAMTAVIFGFCYTVPMYRDALAHDYVALFYVGISLVFYTLILLSIHKYLSRNLLPFVSLSALFIFVFSSYRIGYTDRNSEAVEFHRSVVEDFDVIRKFTREKNTLLPITNTEEETKRLVGARHGLHYYLSGGGILFNDFSCDRTLEKVDYVIQTRRDEVSGLLTPDNQTIFLYDRYLYEERIDKIIEESTPLIRGYFDVYLTDNRELVYIRDRCSRNDSEHAFRSVPLLLFIYPVGDSDLSDLILYYEIDLNFSENFVVDTRRYVVIFDLPEYDIASIDTGQYANEARIWGGRFFGPEHTPDVNLSQLIDQIVASKKPIIRGHYNVYLSDGETLIYVREPCAAGDINDRFLVHIFPASIEDLPEHRRQYGFDNMDFDFFDMGFQDDRKCAAVIQLPDYDIVRIRTGQYSDEGTIWQSEFSASDG